MGQETKPENLSNAAKEAVKIEAVRKTYIHELRQHPGEKRLSVNAPWSKVNAATYDVCKYWEQRLGRPVDFNELPELREKYLSLGSTKFK